MANFFPPERIDANLLRYLRHALQRLRRLSVWDFAYFMNSEETAITAAYAWGLVPMQCHCPHPNCGQLMGIQEKESQKLGFRWRCQPKRGIHRKAIYVSPTRGTFFERVHLSFLQVFRLIYLFIRNDKVSSAREDCDIGSQSTAVDYYSFLRETCDVIQDHDFVRIGGPDDIVEVDESHLFKRKYNRGRRLRITRHLWVFGCLSRITKQMWIERIPNKARPTLDRIMRARIRPRSFIMSDYHRSYLGVDRRLNFKGHGRVNHSRRFVEGTILIQGVRPRLGVAARGYPGHRNCKVHINNIENSWKQLKNKLRTCRSPRLINGYIGEYLYRRNFLNPLPTFGEKIRRVLTDIPRLYPGFDNWNLRVRRPGQNCACGNCP